MSLHQPPIRSTIQFIIWRTCWSSKDGVIWILTFLRATFFSSLFGAAAAIELLIMLPLRAVRHATNETNEKKQQKRNDKQTDEQYGKGYYKYSFI
jgi:MFS superfamily sulfate permease-like transporter